MTASHTIGSGRPIFTIPDFRIWAMNGAHPLALAIAEQSAAQAAKDVRKK